MRVLGLLAWAILAAGTIVGGVESRVVVYVGHRVIGCRGRG